MKKIIIFALVCAALVSCTGNDLKVNRPEGCFEAGQTVILSVNTPQTKVTSAINGTTGGVDFVWEAGDQIKVTIGAKSSLFTLIKGEGTATAKFKGVMPDAGDKFDVQYPATDPDLTSQTYSSTEPLAHNMMKFTATNCTLGTAFTLTPAFSALKLNLYGTDQTVGKIVITDKTVEPNVSYTLNSPAAGVAIGTTSAAATPFYAVLPAGSRKFSVDVYDNASTKAIICSYSTSAAKTFTAGQVVVMPAKKVKVLVIEFSVSATKKVLFTKSNIYWNGSALKFEPTQYAQTTSYSSTHVAHFFYATSLSVAVGNSSPVLSVSDVCCFAESAGGVKVEGESGLYILTPDEWRYLLSAQGVVGRSASLRKANVTVCGSANCLVIAPDEYEGTIASSYTADEWDAGEAEGLVCIPSNGLRHFNEGPGSNFIEKTGEFYCMCAGVRTDTNPLIPYLVCISGSAGTSPYTPYVSNPEGEDNAFVVRLVKNVPKGKEQSTDDDDDDDDENEKGKDTDDDETETETEKETDE